MVTVVIFPRLIPEPVASRENGYVGPLALENPPAGWVTGINRQLFQVRELAIVGWEEEERLRTWIAQKDNRTRLQADPGVIEEYHLRDADRGGRLDRSFEWFPRRIREGSMPNLRSFISPAFWRSVSVSAAKDLEFVAVEMESEWTELHDLDLSKCVVQENTETGRKTLRYHTGRPPPWIESPWRPTYAAIIRGYVVSTRFDWITTHSGWLRITDQDLHPFLDEVQTLLAGK